MHVRTRSAKDGLRNLTHNTLWNLFSLQLLETSELCESRTLRQNINTCAELPPTEIKYMFSRKR